MPVYGEMWGNDGVCDSIRDKKVKLCQRKKVKNTIEEKWIKGDNSKLLAAAFYNSEFLERSQVHSDKNLKFLFTIAKKMFI